MKLDPETDVLLDCLSEAFYGAPKTRLVRAAVLDFIRSELAANPGIRERFYRARGERIEAWRRIVEAGKPHLASIDGERLPCR